MRSAALVASAGSILFTLLFLGFSLKNRSDEIARTVEHGRQLRLDGRHDDATNVLARGMALARSIPWSTPVSKHLSLELKRSRRDRKIDRIHRLAELLRFQDASEIRPSKTVESLVRAFPEIWRNRADLLSENESKPQSLDADLLELSTVWAELALQSDSIADVDALRTLDETRAEIGRTPELDGIRAEFRNRLHMSPFEDSSVALHAAAEDHAGLGRVHLRAGRLERAREEFGRVLAERPEDFWANFYDGVCAYRLHQPADAAAAFRACLALQPKSAECLYNYALALESLGRDEEARHVYDRAARLDPNLVSARLNRGLSLFRAGDPEGAIRDLREASRHSSDRETLGRIHDAWALVDLAEGRVDEARSHSEIAADFGSAEAKARLAALNRRRTPSLTPGSARSAPANLR